MTRTLRRVLATVSVAVSAVAVVPAPANALSMIDPAIAVGAYPLDSEFTPKGDKVFTVNSVGNSVTITSTKSGKVLKTINVGGTPRTIEFLRSGKRAYVFNLGDSTMSVIDVKKGRVSSTLPLPTGLNACRLTPDQRAVACSANSGEIGIFSLKNSDLLDLASPGYVATDIDWAVDNTRVLLTSQNGDRVVVLTWPGLDPVASTTVGDGPIWSAVSTDGSTLYVPVYGDNVVKVIDATDGSIDASISMGDGCSPASITVSPDGARAYVPCYGSGWIKVINLGTNTVVDGEGTYIYSGIEDVAINKKGTLGVVTNYEEDAIGFLIF